MPSTRPKALESPRRNLWARWSSLILHLYAPEFRETYGDEILDLHRQPADGGRSGQLRAALRITCEALRHGPANRLEYRQRRRRRQQRHRRRGLSMDLLLLDLRQALRQLQRKPSQGLLLVATLALSIGTATAIFSIVDQVLLRQLEFEEPERLMRFWGSEDGVPDPQGTIAYLDLFDWHERTSSFEGVAAYDEWSPNLTGGGEPERLVAATVSANFFDLLGVRPQQGRFFLPEEDVDGQDAVVVLSDGLWQRRFAGDPTVVGRDLLLNDRPHRVVGVAPPLDYTGLAGDRRDRAQLWRPNGYLGVAQDRLPNRGSESWAGIGRLRDGVSHEHAQLEIANVARQLAQEYPDSNTGRGVLLIPLHDQVVGGGRSSLLLLTGAVSLLLLVALVNVTGLLLGRAAERRHETTLRAALGAGRWTLVRRDLAEGVLLSSVGCLLALPTAWLGLRLMLTLAGDSLPREVTVALDWRVLVFAMGASLAAGVLCSVPPGLSAMQRTTSKLVRERSGLGATRSLSTRNLLVVAEVGLSLVLLFGAALLGLGLWNLHAIDPGMDVENVLTFRVAPPRQSYPNAAALEEFYSSMLRELETIPGVTSVALTNIAPLSGGFDGNGIWADDWAEHTIDNELSAQTRTVSPGYFQTMGIDLYEGRGFSAQDDSRSEPVAILSRRLAERLWPDSAAVDRFVRSSADESQTIRVVGVVEDVKHLSLEDDAPSWVYFPRAQGLVAWQLRRTTVVLRTRDDPFATELGLVATIRERVRSLDPTLPLADIQTMTQLVDRSIAEPRLRTALTLSFALGALLLTAVGLYAVISHAVTLRQREVAIRMALGAARRRVASEVLAQTLTVVSAGIALGGALSLVAGKVLENLIYDLDWGSAVPVALAPVAIVLLASIAASLSPALRASRVEPNATLRDG